MEPNKDNKSDQVNNFKCFVCEFKTNELEVFYNHVGICQMSAPIGTQTDEVLDDLEDSSDEDLSTTTTKKKYTCSVCNYSTSSLSVHEEHKKEHNKPKRFPCDFCEKVLDSFDHLLKHVDYHRQNRFECSLCPEAFPHSDLLMMHVRGHLSFESPASPSPSKEEALIDTDMEAEDFKKNVLRAEHTCTTCERTFYSLTLYENHMECHENSPIKEKPWHIEDETIILAGFTTDNEYYNEVVPDAELQNESADAVTQAGTTSLDNKIDENENISQQEETAEELEPMDLEEDVYNSEEEGGELN